MILLVVGLSELKTVTKDNPNIKYVGEKSTHPFSIQTAIDSAQDGKIITVPPGTYFENLNFKGKSITLKV